MTPIPVSGLMSKDLAAAHEAVHAIVARAVGLTVKGVAIHSDPAVNFWGLPPGEAPWYGWTDVGVSPAALPKALLPMLATGGAAGETLMARADLRVNLDTRGRLWRSDYHLAGSVEAWSRVLRKSRAVLHGAWNESFKTLVGLLLAQQKVEADALALLAPRRAR